MTRVLAWILSVSQRHIRSNLDVKLLIPVQTYAQGVYISLTMPCMIVAILEVVVARCLLCDYCVGI